ncbi:MAG: right-handed parallel beta-helix repeat-containing protein [Sedimentisphaerales bacterium]
MTGGTNLKTWVVMSVFLLGIGCTAAAGRTIFVDDDGPADFNNIQAAINDANDGDTIIVADGTYTGDGNRDIEFLGKAIVLRSENGPENCIIDCNGTEAEPHRGFFFRHGEDANSVLDGFTIRNGYDQVSGGGIVCSSVSPTICNCIITNNRAKDDGGGIICHTARPTIRDCIITKNRAEVWEGGGILFRACKGATLDNCLITENSAVYGGGIGSSGDNSPIYRDIIVTNCTFSANSAQYGGAVYVRDGSKPSIVNCILWGDTALYGPEIALVGFWPEPFLYVSFSDVQGGEADVYDYGYLYWEPGNINSDPCFADPCNGDYHLKSQAGRWDANEGRWTMDEVTSPCIDAGNPGCPLGDEPNDPNNVRINMGAYGGTAEAGKSPPNWRGIADITNDWIVDFNDLGVFVGYWLETGECILSDLNRNQSVDFADFALIALHWLRDEHQ